MNISSAGKTFSLLRNLLDTTKQTLSPIEFTEKKPLLLQDSTKCFERVTPEECGIDSIFIKNYAEALFSDKDVMLQSIIIMRHGKVVFEASSNLQNADFPTATFSQCKSIVALGIGILVTTGRLKLSERVIDIFTEKASPVSKMRLAKLTVKHLLNMTSPVLFNEGEAMVTEDWLKGYLNSDIEGGFGRKFRYNSINTYILSAIITERTGLSLSEFLANELFSHLGITDFYWEKCPNGLEKGGWGLYIRREDILKLGLLVMQNGVWEGKRLISERFIEEATKAKIAVSDEFGRYDYGYHIWCGKDRDSFLFNGVFGQDLLGLRDQDIIIAVNCGNGDTFQQGRFFEITHEFFDRGFDEVLPKNKKGLKALREFAVSISDKNPFPKQSFLAQTKKSRILDDDLNAIDGKVFEFSGNNTTSTGFYPLLLQLLQGNYSEGLLSVDFKRNKNGLIVHFNEKDETHTLNVGFIKPEASVINSHGEFFTVYAVGCFTENEDGIPTLRIDCDFIETPFSRCYKFYFNNQSPYAIFTETPGNDISRIASVVTKTSAPHFEIMGSVVTKFDGDYFNFKFEKAFSPKLFMKEIE